ncbi:MAG: NAD-dependent epimerase, partial [Alistipes sp.]|nr:NAD-dependent epimerase [Alistipes sp.]
IIEGVTRVIDSTPQRETSAEIYNIGHGSPIQLMEFISILEEALGTKANIKMEPMQKGDVYTTYADTTKLERNIGYKPCVTLREGVEKFVKWHKSYIENN